MTHENPETDFIKTLYEKGYKKLQEYKTLLRERQYLDRRIAQTKNYMKHVDDFLKSESQPED